MRPDTLCRVAFYPVPQSQDPSESNVVSDAVWIPSSLMDGETATTVWVVSRTDQTVSSRTITPGPGKQNGLREITHGLRANEWIVLESKEPLQEGTRVNIINKKGDS
jgi:hypothetical protein